MGFFKWLKAKWTGERASGVPPHGCLPLCRKHKPGALASSHLVKGKLIDQYVCSKCGAEFGVVRAR